MKTSRFLFLLKHRTVFEPYADSYGLINSARQIIDYLESKGNTCHLATVVDANCIDHEVCMFRPDIVVIEALWVPPYKMKEIIELWKYRNIKWVVRVHSNIGFLAAEGQAFKYVNEYLALGKSNLFVTFNNEEFTEHINRTLHHRFECLPNIITEGKIREHYYGCGYSWELHIGCFGSMRIMKNHCFQALCAIEAAEDMGKTLYFHVNLPAADNDRNPVLKNLIEIFKNTKHKLVFHKWMNNHEFNHLIRQMDLGLQLSYSESFNIVSAEFVNNGVPVIVDDAISWMPWWFKSSPVDFDKLVKAIKFAYKVRNLRRLNLLTKSYLHRYNVRSKNIWNEFLLQSL